MNEPTGISVDGKGNLYIADYSNHRIRKVDHQGRISTVAGTGKEGFFGDAGPAIEAQLSFPFDVKADAHGNLFISDLRNNRVRKVGTDGIIKTVVGGGKNGSDKDFESALDAQLTGPEGLAFDKDGNLFIAETLTNRVRKLDHTGSLKIVAGFNTATKGFSGDGGQAIRARLYNPVGLAVDARGNLFIADRQNDCVRMVSPDGIIRTIAGNGLKPSGFSGDGGPARDAILKRPTGLAVDASGNLYVSDQNNHRVRMVTLRADPSHR